MNDFVLLLLILAIGWALTDGLALVSKTKAGLYVRRRIFKEKI